MQRTVAADCLKIGDLQAAAMWSQYLPTLDFNEVYTLHLDLNVRSTKSERILRVSFGHPTVREHNKV